MGILRRCARAIRAPPGDHRHLRVGRVSASHPKPDPPHPPLSRGLGRANRHASPCPHGAARRLRHGTSGARHSTFARPIRDPRGGRSRRLRGRCAHPAYLPPQGRNGTIIDGLPHRRDHAPRATAPPSRGSRFRGDLQARWSAPGGSGVRWEPALRLKRFRATQLVGQPASRGYSSPRSRSLSRSREYPLVVLLLQVGDP